MKKEALNREEYMRVYHRCRWRALRIAKLTNPNDVKAFVEQCMEDEIKGNRQRPLKKDEKLKRPQKLIVKQKRREKKPRKHEYVYVRVPSAQDQSEIDRLLTDFFVDPNKIQDPKKDLDQFMREPRNYEEIMKKIKELEQK